MNVNRSVRRQVVEHPFDWTPPCAATTSATSPDLFGQVHVDRAFWCKRGEDRDRLRSDRPETWGATPRRVSSGRFVRAAAEAA